MEWFDYCLHELMNTARIASTYFKSPGVGLRFDHSNEWFKLRQFLIEHEFERDDYIRALRVIPVCVNFIKEAMVYPIHRLQVRELVVVSKNEIILQPWQINDMIGSLSEHIDGDAIGRNFEEERKNGRRKRILDRYDKIFPPWLLLEIKYGFYVSDDGISKYSPNNVIYAVSVALGFTDMAQNCREKALRKLEGWTEKKIVVKLANINIEIPNDVDEKWTKYFSKSMHIYNDTVNETQRHIAYRALQQNDISATLALFYTWTNVDLDRKIIFHIYFPESEAENYRKQKDDEIKDYSQMNEYYPIILSVHYTPFGLKYIISNAVGNSEMNAADMYEIVNERYDKFVQYYYAICTT